MRQPQVAPLPTLLLALVLVLPVLDAGRLSVLAAAFLAEFLGAGAPLSRLTAAPRAAPLDVPGVTADRYGSGGRTPLVLVHGLAPEGKDDPRLVAAARLLARLGFDVAVPTVPGLTRLRLRPADRDTVVATLGAQGAPSVMVGVSVGAGVALLAAADARVRDRVPLVVSLGGYASASSLARYYLTGEYAGPGIHGRRVHDPALVRLFLNANPDLLDPSAERVLRAASADEVARGLARLSPSLRTLLAALSPVEVLRDVSADLVLVHGRDDVAVPFTESLALARARPTRSRLVLVGVVQHVEPSGVPAPGEARDLLALWSVVYALAARA